MSNYFLRKKVMGDTFSSSRGEKESETRGRYCHSCTPVQKGHGLKCLTWDKRDAIICKLSIATLCDGAQKSFKNLAPLTITSFAQFSKFFITIMQIKNPWERNLTFFSQLLREILSLYRRVHKEIPRREATNHVLSQFNSN